MTLPLLTATMDLEYPPSANHLYATVQGRRVLSRAGKAYTAGVWLVCRELGLVAALPAPVRVTLHVYPPDNRRRDLDNLTKIVLDSLQKAHVLHNDSDVAELHLWRCRACPPVGYVHVQLETII